MCTSQTVSPSCATGSTVTCFFKTFLSFAHPANSPEYQKACHPGQVYRVRRYEEVLASRELGKYPWGQIYKKLGVNHVSSQLFYASAMEPRPTNRTFTSCVSVGISDDRFFLVCAKE